MNKVEDLIKETIKNCGAISFRDFMELALYAPNIGYYNRETTKIGRAGDFYTSSSLHKSFAAIIALQAEEMWHILDCPDRFVFVEFGAGMGHFAKDFLDYLKEKPLFDKIQYHIIEINPYLIANQRKQLNEYCDKVKWFKDINDIEPFEGLVFSNELLDAFAIHLIEITDNIAFEIWIDYEDGIFKEIKRLCNDEILCYLKEFCPYLIDNTFKIDKYRTEVNLSIKAWLTSLANKLIEGFIITIDYGYGANEYYAPERNRGTLLCYHRHRVDDNPYENVGEKDLTAHVNFSSLVKWGGQLGLKSCGFTNQGSYIISMGIDKVIVDLYGNNPDAFELAKIKGLFVPDGFGDSHKILIQYKGKRDFHLRGFSIRNSLKRLLVS